MTKGGWRPTKRDLLVLSTEVRLKSSALSYGIERPGKIDERYILLAQELADTACLLAQGVIYKVKGTLGGERV